jgi:quinol monooxygenase YgiN
MGEVVVVAVFTVKDGREADAEAMLSRLIESSHEEPGNVRYALHRGVDDPRRLVIVERWRSRADLDEHFTKPYVAGLGTAAGELLAQPPVVVFCEPVPVGDVVKGVLA